MCINYNNRYENLYANFEWNELSYKTDVNNKKITNYMNGNVIKNKSSPETT